MLSVRWCCTGACAAARASSSSPTTCWSAVGGAFSSLGMLGAMLGSRDSCLTAAGCLTAGAAFGKHAGLGTTALLGRGSKGIRLSELLALPGEGSALAAAASAEEPAAGCDGSGPVHHAVRCKRVECALCDIACTAHTGYCNIKQAHPVLHLQDALGECEAWSALRIATCQSYVNIIIAKCSVMMHMRLCAITYDLELQRT